MQGTTSIRPVLLAAVAILVFSNLGYAEQVTIQANQGANVFLFQNIQTTTATDFRVFLLTLGAPAIGNGDGGAPFPNAHFEQGAPIGGGFFLVTYDGGSGVPSGLIYAHSFPGWPVGTTFDVLFSYTNSAGQTELRNPKVVGQGGATAQGQTTPTPEPATLVLLGTSLVGVAIKTRTRLKRARGNKKADSSQLV